MITPTLIILGGFAGAGKTTVARQLSSEFCYPLFSSDELNDQLRAALNKEFHEVSPMAYDLLWFLTKRHLSNGVTVIADMNMCSEYTWKVLDALKEEMPEVRVLPIILSCSIDTHKRRIEHRGVNDTEHLNLGGDKFEDILSKYEFINSLKRSDLIRVDAEGSPSEVYTSVKKVIGTK